MKFLGFAVSLLATSTALAQDTDEERGPYFGAGLGIVRFQDWMGFDDAGLANKIFGGFQFNESWAIEGAYTSTTTLTDVPSSPFWAVRTNKDLDIIQVKGLFHRGPFFTSFGLWSANIATSIDLGRSGSASDRGISLGIGGEWEKGKWTFRTEYEVLDSRKQGLSIDTGTEASALSFGVRFNFN